MMALGQLICMYTLTFFLLEASKPTTACVLNITDPDFEINLHKIREQKPAMIKLKLYFNTNCINEKDFYYNDEFKYTLTHYAIVNDQGKRLLQFPLDSGFFSFGILSSRTNRMEATVSLSEECFDLTCDEIKSEVFELVINSCTSADYIPCTFHPQKSTLDFVWAEFLPPRTWNTYTTICQKDTDAITINPSLMCYVIYWTGISVFVFSLVCAVLIPLSHNDNYPIDDYFRGDSPFSVQRMLLYSHIKVSCTNRLSPTMYPFIYINRLSNGMVLSYCFMILILFIFYLIGTILKYKLFPDETLSNCDSVTTIQLCALAASGIYMFFAELQIYDIPPTVAFIIIYIRHFVMVPFMFPIQFFTYGILIGTPFYPTFSLPIATIAISAVGYLVKFYNEFQRPYICILDAMFDLEQSETINKDKFNELCAKYRPICTNILYLLAKIGFTAVIYFISLNSIYLGEFKSETFETVLKTVMTLVTPFLAAFCVGSNSTRELSVLEKTVKWHLNRPSESENSDNNSIL